MADKIRFNLSQVFPEWPPGSGRHEPFPKQELIFSWLNERALEGGGCFYQGGKGSGKTIVGSAAVIHVHHEPQWQGCTSLIGRETYPSLTLSTADEFFKMVEALPDQMVKAASKPSKNSIGYVEWAVGGKTILASLSNSDTWESANLGFAWVDEGHRQNPRVIRDLETRLRQPDSPRAILVTTNPAGRGWMWKMANPASPDCRPNWKWVEASTVENPALPPDYHARLERTFGKGTPAYKRWVLGRSTALEGSVFTEFDDDADNCIHVVPPMDLPQEWDWGRGVDYGLVNPTAVIWACVDDTGAWWVDRCHYAPQEPEDRQFWTVSRHAEKILDTDLMYENLQMFPADPSMWIQRQKDGIWYSTADEFQKLGVQIYQGDNDRQSGLQQLLDLIAIDPTRTHVISLKPGAPKLCILDRPCNAPLIQELLGLLWARPDGTADQGRPDDCQKKNDHAYDALRYLVKERPMGMQKREPIIQRGKYQVSGTGGRTRRY